MFREIGSDRVTIYRLGYTSEFAEVGIRMDKDAADHRQAAASFDWIGWQASARQFLTSVDAVITWHKQREVSNRPVRSVGAE